MNAFFTSPEPQKPLVRRSHVCFNPYKPGLFHPISQQPPSKHPPTLCPSILTNKFPIPNSPSSKPMIP